MGGIIEDADAAKMEEREEDEDDGMGSADRGDIACGPTLYCDGLRWIFCISGVRQQYEFDG
jgi:hypothetical protein